MTVDSLVSVMKTEVTEAECFKNKNSIFVS